MEKNEIIIEMKKKLKHIYDDFQQRMDRNAWKDAVKDAAEAQPEAALKAAVEFAVAHLHIPASCIRSLLLMAGLRNHPAAAAEMYSEAIVRRLLKRMTAEDPVRYSLIDPDLPEKELEEFVGAVREAKSYLEKGQAYLAGMKAAEAEHIFPGHPDVALLQAQIACFRYDYNGAERFLQPVFSTEQADSRFYELRGDIYAAKKNYPQARSAYLKAQELSKGSENLNDKIEAVSAKAERTEKTAESIKGTVSLQMEEAKRLEHNGDVEKAEQIYQTIIAKDYRQFEAYYPLGKLYLKQKRWDEADYLAEILLDFRQNAAKALLLKGFVLESTGKGEDALFYYNSAALEEPNNMEVFCQRKRLTALLDHDEKGVIQAVQALKNLQTIKNGKDKAAHSEIFSGMNEKEWQIRKIDENARELLGRGRMTEAYYDLMKKCAEYPESAVLACRKAEILTLMGREAEARQILSELKNDPEWGEKAANALYDLDYKIVGEHKENDVGYDVLPEIYFNTGKYEACREAVSNIEADKMTAQLLKLKGRCQVIDGHFSEALKSFDAALSMDPSIQGVRLMKGMLLQSKRDFKGALTIYDEALKRGEDIEAASGIKAALLYEQERNAELLVFRSDAAKMDRRSYDVDGFVGLVYMERTPYDGKSGIDYLENAISAGSENINFYVAAVQAYLADERHYAALCAVENGLTVLPVSKELFALKAEVLYRLSKLEAAELTASTLLSENPKDARLHYLMGKIRGEQGNEKDAMRWLKSAAELEEQNHTYIYAYADRCFETGDRKNAELYYGKAIQLNPRDYISLKRRAILLQQRGEDEKAIADIRASLSIHPNDAEAYVILGNIVAMYDIEDTAEELEAADTDSHIGNEPENDGENGIGEKEGEGGDTAKQKERVSAESEETTGDGECSGVSDNDEIQATSEDIKEKDAQRENEEDVSEEAEDLFREDEAPWSYARRNSEEDEKGHEMLNRLIDEYSANPEFYFYKAISIDPKYRESYISLAKYQAESGNYSQAIKHIEKAISLNGELTDGYMVKGIICHLKGDNEEAIRSFREVRDREPENLKAYSYISKCCNAAGRYAEAVEAAEKGLQIDGNYVNFFVNKGVALYHLNQYEEAVEALSKVIANQNTIHTAAVESAYRYRGMSYEKAQDTEKALTDYHKLLRLNPDRRDIKKRVNELEKQVDESKPKSRLSSIFRRKK